METETNSKTKRSPRKIRKFQELKLGAKIFDATQKRLREIKVQESKESFEELSEKLRENQKEKIALEEARRQAGRAFLRSPAGIKAERERRERWSKAQAEKNQMKFRKFISRAKANEKRVAETRRRRKSTGFLADF